MSISGRQPAERQSVADEPAFLRGGGRMGELIRQHPWQRSALGPPSGWPRALRAACRMMLSTHHPVCIFWGDQHVCLYNDAYARSLGDEKHPAILGCPGAEAWPETWALIGPQVAMVMRGEGATWHENQRVPIHRNGAIEDVYWTYGYGPIDDEDAPGGVGGVLVLCSETTAQVEAERRLRESDERLRLALEVAGLRVWELDVGTGLVLPSQGAPEAERGRPVPLAGMLANLHPEDAARVTEGLRSTIAGGPPFDEEFRVLAPGQELTLHSRARLVRAASGRPKLVGVIEDVTAARDNAVALREARSTMRRRERSDRDKLARLFQQAPSFIAIFGGPEHRFEFVNDAHVRLFGERDAIGRTAQEVFPELAEQGIFEVMDHVLRTGERYVATELPVTLTKPDGSPGELILDFVFEPMRDADGAATGVFLEGFDVTARTQAQRERRASEERLAAIFRDSSDYILATDLEMRLTAVNPAAAQALGYAVEDVVGRSIADFVAEDGFETNRAMLARKLREGGATRYTLTVVARDGSRRLWEINSKLTHDAEGRPVGLHAIARDVSEERAASSALRESEERFRAMADSSPLMIWINDADAGVEFVNRTYCEFFGVTTDGIVGRDWQGLLHPESAGYVREFLAANRERVPFDHRAQVRHADGSWRWIRSYAKPRFGAHGEYLGMVGNSTDITDVVEAELAVREAARQKDEFLAMLAHELRNPMAPIRNAAELLSRTLPADSPLLPVSALLRRQASQLSRLVDDLLDVSRITQGRIELKLQRMDLNAAIAQALETVEPLIRERGHTLRSQTSTARLWIDADPERMVQALSNVLTNAAKYTDPGGQIRVIAHASATEAIVAVADSGIGIPEEMLPRVFDLFVQSDRALDRSQGGLGIGLSVVRRLVEMHGGTVGATSGGSGTGSTFEIRLPLRSSPTQSAAAAAPLAVPARRILIVDDNADAAESLAMLLNIEGHAAEFVTQPRLALARAPLLRPDVVLLDIGMPEMDGFEVAHRLRQMPELARSTIVAVTGYGQSGDRKLSAAAGFDAHLVKPVEYAALARVLERTVAVDAGPRDENDTT
jgi:PAS domain S-box-containing protein